ncbi:hypothetical protein P7D50_00635 [Enterococcus dongliensis]|nr:MULTISPECIES: hypothetical protein [Enterococcus]MDT2427179.1 hypothetical protein [Enterococcus avium]MDT2646331.1 hypothetical protein [Enterococcus dongliensis]MDT2669500.1 hypothetical protein [Enterococcus dongliensis]
MENKDSLIKIIDGYQSLEVIPPQYGQVILTFHDGKIKLVEECKKTQV